MPRWALGTLVVSPLSVLLGQGKLAVAVAMARETFIGFLMLMSLWLVVGLGRKRRAL